MSNKPKSARNDEAPRYIIEKGVPVPSRQRTDTMTFAFQQMQCGDSIFFAGKRIYSVSAASRVLRMKKKLPAESRFTCRTMDGGVRVWRIT